MDKTRQDDPRVMITRSERWDRDNERREEYDDYRKLSSVGCMERFNITRDEMHLSRSENRTRNFEYRNSAEHEERKIQNLLHRGYRPFENESNEEFIERCTTGDNHE